VISAPPRIHCAMRSVFNDDANRGCEKHADARGSHELHFGECCDADTTRTRFDLSSCDLDTLVRFGVRAELFPRVERRFLQLLDIGFQVVEIDEQCRCWHLTLQRLHRRESISDSRGSAGYFPR
jgi:hypothetical protein